VFGVNVLPDVEFRPVRQGENAQALAVVNVRVEEIPKFRALVARVPLTALIAEGKDTLLGTRTLFVTPSATNGGIKTALAQTVEQRGCLECAAAALGTPGERSCAFVQSAAICVHDQLEAEFGGVAVAEFDHFPELVPGVDVEKG